MEKLVEEQEEYCDVLFGDEVTKLNDHDNGTDDRICIITETQIIYYKRKKVHKCYQWANLVGANYDSQKNQFNFFFNEKLVDDSLTNSLCRFQTEEGPQLALIIGQFLSRFFSDKEKSNNFRFKTFESKTPEQNPRIVLSRYKSMIEAQLEAKKITSREFRRVENSLKNLLKRRNNSVFISEKTPDIDKAMDSVLYALQNYKYAETFVETILEKESTTSKILNLRKKYFPFKHIILRNKNTEEISNFFKNLPENFQTEAFSFEEIPFDDKIIKSIEKVAKKRQITAFGFWNCFGDDKVDEICTKIIDNSKSLNYLSFRLTKGLNLGNLFSRIKNIKHLSLESIDKDVSEIMKQICDAEFTQLESLCITDNHGREEFQDGCLPKSLIRIEADRVEWGERMIGKFVSFLRKQHLTYKMQLNLSDAKISEEDAKEVFSLLSKNANIETFIWIANPIVEETARFIMSNKSLRVINLSLCFDSNTATFIPDIAEAMKVLENLEVVDVKGDDEHFVGTQIAPILDAVKELPNIEHIDVAGQKVTCSELSIIEEIIEKCLKINFVSFDECVVESLGPITNVLEKAISKNTKIQIPRPDQTIKQLEEDEVISDDDIESVELSLYQIENPGEEIDENDLMGDPYDFPVSHTRVSFPYLETEQFLNELEKAKIENNSSSSVQDMSESSSSSPELIQDVPMIKGKKSLPINNSPESSDSDMIIPPKKKSTKPLPIQIEDDSSDSEEIIPRKSKKTIPLQSDSDSELIMPRRQSKKSLPIQNVMESSDSEPELIIPKKKSNKPISIQDSSDSSDYDLSQLSKNVIPSSSESGSEPIPRRISSDHEGKKKARQPKVVKGKFDEPDWSLPKNVKKPFDNKKVAASLQKKFRLDNLLRSVTEDN